MAAAIDPITLEVVRGFLVSTVLQMRATLVRTAYAPIVYETKDFSCGLLTTQGELAAMSEDFSGHVFAMALGLNATQEKFEDRIYPGDVLAVNDPYTGGTHMNDIAFYTPFFADGKLLLFIGVRVHFADVGGATPGSFSGQDTEIYQEGMRILPVKLVDRGELNQGLWDVLFANMRLRDEREGDALAMLDTARVAEMAIAELCDRYGGETVGRCIDALIENAEEMMRERVAQLPDGDYYYEHYMDNGGLSPEPLPIRVKLAIQGDSMAFDFTGTAPQVSGPMNCGVPVSQGAVFVIVKSWLDPKTPVNGGTFRPMRFVIPSGSCLAAQLPAAVGGCWEVYRQLQSAVIGVFGQVIPDDVGAENLGTANHTFIAGYDRARGKHYLLYEYPHGGNPATSATDGMTGSQPYDAGDLPCAQPAESIEQRQPLLIESLQVWDDGEGPGRRRSGFGVVRRIRVLSEDSQLNVMGDRAVIPPWGAAQAPPGSLNSVTVVRDGMEMQPAAIPGKIRSFPLRYGDVVLMRGSAGGGVGDPLDREAQLVEREVSDGYVSRERAEDVYGVVLDGGGVDRALTERRRDQLRRERRRFEVLDGEADEFDRHGCRVGRLSRVAADGLGVGDGDMIEYVAEAGAPLRAWASVSDAPGDGVVIGPVGRSILGVRAGQQVWVRPLKVGVQAGM